MEHEVNAHAEHDPWLSSFGCSGSIVGNQVTMLWYPRSTIGRRHS
jgi:hypothetical protein